MSLYAGHILRVNLSSGAISKESVSEVLQRKLTGGVGFGAGDLAANNQISKALQETGTLCNFADSGMTYEILSKFLEAATGY